MDLKKAYQTSSPVNIDPTLVLKDKLARRVGRRLPGTYSNKNHRQFAEIYRDLIEDLPKICKSYVVMYFV